VNHQLLSRPCNLWKYFSAHIGILVLKCFSFTLHTVLQFLQSMWVVHITLSFSIPHINNRDSD
jgi:uncharacterized membrane protein required for colicin V production